MRLTLIDADEATVEADVDDARVLVSPEDLEAATGWELRPEGLCRGEVCVPVRGAMNDANRVDLQAVAAALGRALVVDADGGVAALAGDPMRTGRADATIDALELPAVDGQPMRMSDLAGRKRLLVAWASW